MPEPINMEIEIVSNERVIHFLPEPQKSSVKGVYYGIEDDYDNLVAVIGVIRRAWYETEIRHLYVHSDFRRRGLGKALIQRAFKGTRAVRAIATVRKENSHSLRAFYANGFEKIDEFFNPATESEVLILRRTKRHTRTGGNNEASEA